MFARPLARTSLWIVLATLAALLAAAALSVGSPKQASSDSSPGVQISEQRLKTQPRVRFAPLAGRRTPAPIANLEAPLAGRRTPAALAGRRTPAPIANLEAPLAGRRTPAAIANLEAPLAGRRTPAPLANAEVPLDMSKVPGSVLYVAGIAAVALIGAVRERLNRRRLDRR